MPNLKLSISNAKSRQAQRGVTLIELLLYMGLLSIFLTVLSQIFITSLSTQLESESVSGLDQDGKYIIARLSYDIQRSTNITQPGALGLSSSSLSFVAGGLSYQYSQASGILTVSENGTPYQLNSLGTLVSNLQFTRRGNSSGKPTITVSFTLTSTVLREKGQDTKSFSTTIGTR